MSFQGTATISRVSQELSEDFVSLGFQIDESEIRKYICESDVVPDNYWDVWVEVSGFIPGDIKRHPHLVFCTQENIPGSAVNRRYVAINMPNNFPVKVNIKVSVVSHFESFHPEAFHEVVEARVVRERDSKVLKPFFLLEEDRTCDDEFGYLGWGDCLPPTYSVEVDLAEVRRQFQSVEEHNRNPESRENIYLSVTRIIPKPLQKCNNGRVIHKEF